MSLLQPKCEPGYPDNCITLENALEAIQKVFNTRLKPGFRVTSFEVKAITDNKSTMRLAFDRKKVVRKP